MEDIRQTGPVGLKGINTQNNKVESDTGIKFISRTPTSALAGYDTPVYSNTGDLGSSKFDNPILTLEQLQDVENMRAENQHWSLKWLNGITKGAVLAGTTFLDGTVGLVLGLTDVLINIGNKNETGWEKFSRLWDNEFSNGLQKINQLSEQWLPNYRTTEERDREWYKNLGTANFWADTFLKNMGFTVGAYYSGKGFTSILKGAGLLKSGLGAATAGSIYSAINEARIEANNNSDDFFKLEQTKLQDSYNQELQMIADSESLTNDEKLAGIEYLKNEYQQIQDDLDVRKSKMGLTTFLGNAVFLSLNDFLTIGRLYAKGFETATEATKGATKGATTWQKMDKLWAADQGMASRSGGNIAERTFENISKKKAVGIGLGKATLEGNEELFQKFVSSTAGEWFNTDSPDAYYNAKINSESIVETEDFLSAAIKGFVNSYGSMDSYEEFAVGFLTGALGTPTFGRVQNADASTYLGRNKAIGLTGGIFGELSMANQSNAEGNEAVEYLNKYEKKLQEAKGHFAQTQSFTKAMDGFSEANDKFEYKNAEDNDTFAAISRYVTLGKLDWMRDVVDQDFENISDETLMSIARETSTDVSGWKKVDGSYTPDGEKGAKEMREKLAKKRDDILKDIEQYEKSLTYVKGVANQYLSNDEASELAWYHWKIQKFEDRFKGLKDETKGLDALLSGLDVWEKALVEERFNLTEDKDGDVFKDNTKHLKQIRNLKKFIDITKDLGSKNILTLSKFLKDNKGILDTLSDETFFRLYADESGIQYSEYEQTMNNLKDISRIAIAYDTFNDRLKEFVEDPLKLQKNREKLDAKENAKKKVLENDKKKQSVKNSSVSDLVKKVKEGEISKEDLQSIAELDDIDLSELEKEGVETDSISDKVDKAVDILEKYEDAKNELERKLQSGEINAQQLEDAVSILESNLNSIDVPENLLNTDLESALDPETLNTTEDESFLSAIEQEESKSRRLNDARGILKAVDDKLKNTEKPTEQTVDTTPQGETGRDSTPKVETEQEKKAKKEEPNLTNELDKKVYEVIKQKIPSNYWGKAFKDFKTLIKNTLDLANSNVPANEILNTISKTSEYTLLYSYPELASVIDNYIQEVLKNNKNITSDKIEDIEGEVKTTMEYDDVVEYNDDYDEQAKKEYRESDRSGIINGIKQYWRDVTRRFPIHKEKGNDTPYHEIAKTLKNTDGTPRYTEQQLKRMKAVYDYLVSVNAYSLRDSGSIKPNTEIKFAIDPKLNDEAGEIVILMMDDKGNILGDLPSKNDSVTNTYVDLVPFIEKTEKEYLANKDNLQENDLWVADSKSSIKQVLVGAVHYSEERHSINEIFTDQKGNPIKPIFGVVLSDHSVSTTNENKAANDPISSNAIKPLKLSPGQPVVLIPTGVNGRTHIAVPFAMPRYNAATSRVGIGKVIDEILNTIPNIKTQQDAVKVTKSLKEHLGTVWKVITKDNKEQTLGSFEVKLVNTVREKATDAELRSNISIKENVQQVRITYKPDGRSATALDVTLDLADPNLVQKLKSELYGLNIPFRINRKYLNRELNGVDYNSLIAPLANTNITPGSVHTVNNWFTVNPIKPDGTIRKGSIIKTMGVGNSTKTGKILTLKHNNVDYTIDTDKWTVSDASGKVFTGPKTLKLLGEAFGIYNNLDSEKPYDTPWGKFDPVKKDFIKEDVDRNKQEEYTKKHSTITIKSSIGGEGEIDYTPREFQKKENSSWYYASDARDLDPSRQGIKYHQPRENKGDVSQITWFPEGSYRAGGLTISMYRPLSVAEFETIKSFIETNNPNETALYDFVFDVLYNNKVTEDTKPKTKEDVLKEVKDLGLLNTEKRKKIFNNLNVEQIQTVLNYNPIIRNTVIENLEQGFNSSKNKFKYNVNDLLKPNFKFRKADTTSYIKFDPNVEIEWLNKVLPQYKDRTNLVKGLIKISEGVNPERAWGQFHKSTIVLSDVAAAGTVYHEAFHAVTNTILTKEEHTELFKEAKKLYGVMDDIALEERLAEDFRRYVQTEDLFGGKIVKFFRKIKHFVTSFFGKEDIISKVFYNINNGKYKSRVVSESTKVLNRIVEDNQKEIQELNKLKEDIFKKPLYIEYDNVYQAESQIMSDSILLKGKNLGIIAPKKVKGKGVIYFDSSNFDDLIKSLEGKITKATENKIKRDSENWYKEQTKESKMSLNMLSYQDEYRDRDEYDEIEDYHYNKLMFGNLSMADRRYVIDSGFTIEQWNKLHPEHKESILNCK